MSLLAFVGSAAASRESSVGANVSVSVASVLAAMGMAGYRALAELVVTSDIAITKTVDTGDGPLFAARTLNAWAMKDVRKPLSSLRGIHLARRIYGDRAANTRGFATHYGLDWNDRFARRPHLDVYHVVSATGRAGMLASPSVSVTSYVAVNSILLKEDGDLLLAENGDTLFCG